MDELLRTLNRLPKYLRYNYGLYRPIIKKNDWDGHNYSWKIYYAKETRYGFSTIKPLVYAQGVSLIDAIRNFEQAFQTWNSENMYNPKYGK